MQQRWGRETYYAPIGRAQSKEGGGAPRKKFRKGTKKKNRRPGLQEEGGFDLSGGYNQKATGEGGEKSPREGSL